MGCSREVWPYCGSVYHIVAHVWRIDRYLISLAVRSLNARYRLSESITKVHSVGLARVQRQAGLGSLLRSKWLAVEE